MDLVDLQQDAGSGGPSADLTSGHSMASPRLIDVPGSPTLSMQLPSEPSQGDTGQVQASFDRHCAPSQTPAMGAANYDQSPYGQLHELRDQRIYHAKDTKAALRTRLAAVDAAKKRNAGANKSDADTSAPVLGKKNKTPMGATDTGEAPARNLEKRPRGDALEMASAADLEAAKEHAIWRNPELEPQVGANRSSVAAGVGGAASAWVADGCIRVLKELSLEEEERHAQLVQAAKTKD